MKKQISSQQEYFVRPTSEEETKTVRRDSRAKQEASPEYLTIKSENYSEKKAHSRLIKYVEK
jgi:hypothetical protein